MTGLPSLAGGWKSSGHVDSLERSFIYFSKKSDLCYRLLDCRTLSRVHPVISTFSSHPTSLHYQYFNACRGSQLFPGACYFPLPFPGISGSSAFLEEGHFWAAVTWAQGCSPFTWCEPQAKLTQVSLQSCKFKGKKM